MIEDELNLSNSLVSVINMNSVNERINLYEGKAIFRFEDREVKSHCKIYIEWLPRPYIKFDAVFQERTRINFNEKVKFKLKDDIEEEVLFTKTDIMAIEVSGIFTRGFSLKDDKRKMNVLEFTLINGFDNFGEWIKSETHRYAGRINFSYMGYRIIIDKVHNYKEIFDELKQIGGYSITHHAQILRNDGLDFSEEDGMKLIEAVEWLMSFANGQRVGVCSLCGYQGTKKVLEKYLRPWVDSNKSTVVTWYPKNYPTNDALEDVFPNLVEKLNDELWGDVLPVVLSWYLDSRSSIIVENKIVSIQIALETLAWTYIVEEKEIMDGNIFNNKLRASDKLRMFLYELEIPRKTPNNIMQGLDKKYEDGTYLFTECRNNIVHPKKKKNDTFLKDINKMVGVLNLGINYLELSMLRIIDYNGIYTNLIAENPKERDRRVPWFYC
ncbi:hypothetical protein BAOM_1397 [Peribacillus asahii]|uniref:YopA central domain-containing protein n=1 Tax=Peribacillus asahii TaxID=228899 RepID=A0A3Q9RLL7_9BACI|nr:hypothetical protein [Peribacillus asahii]AZV42007.1 hypothetical protein BAOM_1397 [Peribacillus asahii]